ncbi:MAG: hypothetical protein RSB77_02030 [Bacilli bacterium]
MKKNFIFDILLNFNKEFIEYYEWNTDDILSHIKKIPIFSIPDEKIVEVLKAKKISILNKLPEIKNQTEVYCKRKADDFSYTFLLCSSEKVVAIMLDDQKNIIKKSDLLIDEEDEILENYQNYTKISIELEEQKEIEKPLLITREEKNKFNFIIEKINQSNPEKLKYLAYEITNDNIKINSKKDLINLLNNKNLNILYNLFMISHNN